MSSDIETRILEMKLDNDQFEKGVKSTIQSLEELEEKLELKDAADGFDKVSKAANTMQFSSMERSLDAITDKFSLLGNVGLQALERISNKIVDIGENIIKGLTIDPVMDGWREFEMKTNSIQTIFGGIRNQYANSPLGRSKAFSDIGRELDELNKYADQTIYSFAQMTENVGKFTNQSIGLETATDAIKGVGNWAAMVGADTAQMSRAMYNISQALGGGSMKLIDWRSIKYANMSTPDVQKLFADIAYAQGGMLDKNGKAYKKGSKEAQRAYQSIISDFEGSLRSGWLTNEVMMNGLKVLSGELKGEELVRLFGDTAEAKKLAAYYEDLGAYAAEAATQVKTLTQLIGVFQEALGSGWATTFDKLFGGFQKQTEFFTKIANLVGYFIDRDTTNRNNWVDKFTKANEGTELVTTAILNIIGVFTEFWGLIQDVTQKLISPFNGKYWFNDPATMAIFGGIENNLNDTGMTAQHVAGIISDLNMAFGLFYAWFHGEKTDDNGNVIEKATPAYQNAMKIFAGLGSVVMIALNAIENLFRFGGRILALFEPLASSILNMFGNVGEILYSIYQNISGQHTFSDFFDELYKAVGPTISAIVNFISTILDLIASLFDLGTDLDEFDATARNNKLGPFIKTLSDIFEKFPVILKPALGFITLIFNKMTGFISGITKGFPAIKKHVKKEGVTPFEDLKDIVQEFIAAGFGEETAKSITDWYNNNVKGTFASLVNWFGKAYDSITTFFQELPGKVTKLVERVKAAFNAFQNYNYNDALSPYQNFKDRMQEVIYALFGKEVGDKIVTTFKENIEPKLLEVAGAIESVFGEVKRVLNGLAKVFTSDYTDTENPFDVLQAIALNFLEGYDEGSVDPNAATRKSSVLEFFKNLEESYEKDIKPVIDKVTGWATKDIPQAFDTISGYLFGKEILVNKGEGGLAHLEKEHVPGMFERILAWINGEGKAKLEEITSFFGSTWTSITDAIFGYDTTTGSPEKRAKRQAAGGKTHVDGLVDVLLGNVKSAYEKITGWIDGEGNALWQTATDFFFGEVDAETKKRSGGAIQAIVDWYNEHSAEIEEIFTVKIPVLFGQIRTALFGGQQSVLVGENKDGPIYELQHVDSIFKPVDDWINGDGKAIFDEVIDFFENAWEQLNHVLFGYDDAIDPEGTAVEHIPGLFENLKKWAEDDGTKTWTEITDFIFGKSVTDKAGNVTREGGAFQAIQTFLDPIIDWIKEKGSWLYEYVTTHSFSEMWAKLGELFAGHEVLDEAGNTHFEGGYLSELINVLRPISDFFGRAGNSLFDKITSIDFDAVWQKIDEFFNGKDILVNKGEGGLAHLENEHIDGTFDKIVGFFDRVIGFFESDTWKSIQEDLTTFYETYIHPFLSLFEGTGSTLMDAFNEWDPDKDLFSNILAIASKTSGYFTTELPKIFEQMLPEGFSLTGLLESFFASFGGESNKDPVEEASGNVKKEQEGKSNDWWRTLMDNLSWLNPLNLFMPSSASADEFGQVTEGIDKQSSAIESTSNDIKETVANAQEKLKGVTETFSSDRFDLGTALTNTVGSIGEWFTNASGGLGGILTTVGMVFGLTKTTDIVQALTGNEKDSFIQDLADLFDALSGFMSSITWLLTIATVSDLLSQATDAEGNINSVDHMFLKITELLSYIFRWIAAIAGGSFAFEVATDIGTDIIGDKFKLNYMSDTASPADNIMALGTGLKQLFEGLEQLFLVVIEFLGINFLFSKIDESFFTDQGIQLEKDGKKVSKFEASIDAAMQIVTRILTALVGPIMASLTDSFIYNSATGGIEAMIFKWTSFGDANGLKTRSDSFASALMGVATYMESIMSAISGLLITVSLMSIFTDYNKVSKNIDLIERVGDIVTKLVLSVSGLVTSVALQKIGNSLQGLSISNNAGVFSMATGGKETVSSAMKTLSTIGKSVLWVGAFVGLLLVIADIALIILDKNIMRAGNTIMIASAQVSAALDSLSRINVPKAMMASLAFNILKDVLGTLQDITYYGLLDKNGAEAFYHASSYLGAGFTSLNEGLTGFDPEFTLEAVKKMKEVWESFKSDGTTSGLDVNDFALKAYVLQTAGRNIGMASEAFRGITEEDVGHMDTVKKYMTTFSDIASIMAFVNSFGDFGLSTIFGYGFQPFTSFLMQLSSMGATVKREGDQITGLEELDPEILRGAFTALIDSLPDPTTSKDLYDKLLAFTNAGGGNIGLFVNGLTGLNGALKDYQEILGSLNVADFTEQSKALERIDQLGKIADNDYIFVNGELASNINTRLSLFANDIVSLADGLEKIGEASKDAQGKNYNLNGIANFVTKLYNVGVVQDKVNGATLMSSNFETFAGSFNLFSSSFATFVNTLKGEKISSEDLKAVSTFVNDITASEAMLLEIAPNSSAWEKIFGSSGKLSLIANSLPGLGSGIHSLYEETKSSFLSESDKELPAVEHVLDVTANFVSRMTRSASYLNGISNLTFSFKDLADDLWNTEGTGLFNVLPGLFSYMAGDTINTTGMNTMSTILDSLGNFARRVSAFSYSDYTLSTFGSELQSAFETQIYPAIGKMTLTELQSYAAAFSDLSNALAMNGQTATLVTAIDQAIEALKDKEIQITVTPVWKDGSLAGDLNAPSMTVTPNVTNTYSAATIQNITFPDVQAVRLVPEDMSALTGATREAATTVAGRVDVMSNTIGGLRVQLDTGVLVGYLVPTLNRRFGRDMSPRGPIVVIDTSGREDPTSYVP